MHGHGGYDSDFSDDEQGGGSSKKRKKTVEDELLLTKPFQKENMERWPINKLLQTCWTGKKQEIEGFIS